MTISSSLLPIADLPVDGESLPTVNARDLHAELGVGRDFSTWIKDRVEKFGFREGIDFVVLSVFPGFGENPQGGRPAIEYHLTLDTAKHLAMIENTPKGHEIRNYFIQAEKDRRLMLSGGPNGQLMLNVEKMVHAILTSYGLNPETLRRVVENPQQQLITDGGMTGVFEVIEKLARPHRRRNGLVRRIGNECERVCRPQGISVHRQIGRNHVRVFPRHVIDEVLSRVGYTWIRAHNDTVSGQGVLPFGKPHLKS